MSFSSGQLQHKARKRFGQNFLIDSSIVRSIVRAVNPGPQDDIVEIGPGKGAITGLLLENCRSLNVVELDRDLAPILLARFANDQKFKFNQADALNFNYAALAKNLNANEKIRVVGNLPYNISTPLIFHLLDQRKHIADMHFMLQKEVVLRLAAPAQHKNYGRLSVMAQYFCEVVNLFEVPPESFDPAPKVNSAIVKLVPFKTLPYTANNFSFFEKLVKAAFSQRRKTLRNALKTFFKEYETEIFAVSDFDFSRRAESVAVEEFVDLANKLYLKYT